MAKTDAERMREYRARKRNGVVTVPCQDNVTRVTETVTADRHIIIEDMPHPDVELPVDEVIHANKGIGWPDILSLSRQDIDYVYWHWCTADSILLRLVRVAGYHKRVA